MGDPGHEDVLDWVPEVREQVGVEEGLQLEHLAKGTSGHLKSVVSPCMA